MEGIRLHADTVLDAYALRVAAKHVTELDLIGGSEAHERLWDMAHKLIKEDITETGYSSDIMAVLTLAVWNKRPWLCVLNALRELGAIIEEEEDARAED